MTAAPLEQVMDPALAARIKRDLDRQLTKVIIALRSGELQPQSIADLSGLPLWLVVRIGQDAGLLSADLRPNTP